MLQKFIRHDRCLVKSFIGCTKIMNKGEGGRVISEGDRGYKREVKKY